MLLGQLKVERCLVSGDFGSLVKCQMLLSLRFCLLSPCSKCKGKALLHPVLGEVQVRPGQADDHNET